jgi:hypothetical protein
VKKYKDNHGAACERQSGPQGQTPCSTAHYRLSGL